MPTLHDSPHSPLVTRRMFLGCCAAIAHSACARLALETRAAHALLTDPAPGDYRPVLDGLIKTVLPFEHPAFPVTALQVHTRLLRLFRLETDSRYAAMQRTLQLFDQVDLFAEPMVLAEAERRARDPGDRALDVPAAISVATREDQALFRRFGKEPRGTTFASLPLSRQRDYFDLWRRSGLMVKRQFHGSARAVVLITAYSMPAVWSAIGYDGPVTARAARDSE
jgi:hypothetical protein